MMISAPIPSASGTGILSLLNKFNHRQKQLTILRKKSSQLLRINRRLLIENLIAN